MNNNNSNKIKIDYVSATKIASDSIPIVVLIGIIGNVLSFIIFSRKKFKNTIFDTYFRYMTITDTLTMPYSMTVYLITRFELSIPDWNIFYCKYVVYLTFVSPSISAWLLVGISFDRMINIVFPFKFSIIKKKKLFQYLYCLLASFCCMAVYSPVFIYFQFNSKSNFDNQTNQTISFYYCEQKPEVSIISQFDIFYANVLPVVIMVIFNIVTIKTLFQSRFKSSIGLTKRDIRFAFTSFTLNFFFFFLLIVSQIYFLFFPYSYLEPSEQSQFWQTITSSIYTINFSLIFYVNLIINSMFREELFKIIAKIKNIFNFGHFSNSLS